MLTKLRKKKGLTPGQLASLLGCHRTTIVYYEQGKSLPRLPRALLIATFFGVTIEQLFTACADGQPQNKPPQEEDTGHAA